MLRIRPEPCCRPPNTGLPMYWNVCHAVDGLLSIAMFASAGLSSNAAAPTGVSVVVAEDVLGAPVWCNAGGGALVPPWFSEVSANTTSATATTTTTATIAMVRDLDAPPRRPGPPPRPAPPPRVTGRVERWSWGQYPRSSCSSGYRYSSWRPYGSPRPYMSPRVGPVLCRWVSARDRPLFCDRGAGRGAGRGGGGSCGIGTGGIASTRAADSWSGVVSALPSLPSSIRAWVVISSSTAGTPARTCRGLHGSPSWTGAGGSVGQSGPGQWPVSVAYSSMPSLWVSASPGSSALAPVSAASMPRPVIFTPPPAVQRSESGDRQRCARPAACAAEIASAASAMIRAPRAASSGPLASMSSRESPAAHSLTMYAWSQSSSTSNTCAKRGSLSLLAARAAVTTSRSRGKPGAKVSTVTARASVSSMAFHAAQPAAAATRSSSRYRPPSRVPGSEVNVLTCL